MGRFYTVLASAVAVLVLAGGSAAAQSSISDTGPGSTNTITHDNDTDIDIDCDNDVDVDNHNDQTASSGDASVTGNTSGGNATSGDASNSNNTETNVAAGCGFMGAREVEKPTGGMGGGPVQPSSSTTPTVAKVAGGAVSKVAALPATGTDEILGAFSGLTIGLGALVAASRIAVSAARRA